MLDLDHEGRMAGMGILGCRAERLTLRVMPSSLGLCWPCLAKGAGLPVRFWFDAKAGLLPAVGAVGIVRLEENAAQAGNALRGWLLVENGWPRSVGEVSGPRFEQYPGATRSGPVFPGTGNFLPERIQMGLFLSQ